MSRITYLSTAKSQKGSFILYWMQASVRLENNWALNWALQKASEIHLPLEVLFCLDTNFPQASQRAFAFLIDGLKDVSTGLKENNITFTIARVDPIQALPQAAQNADLVVFDQGYLPIQRLWRQQITQKINCPVVQIEDNLCVPLTLVSSKEEWSAATIRPKILKNLDLDHLTTPRFDGKAAFHSEYIRQNLERAQISLFDFPLERQSLEHLNLNSSILPTELQGGEKKGLQLWNHFLENKLQDYSSLGNDPNRNATSGLSSYLHFGQITPLTLIADLVRRNIWRPGSNIKKIGEGSVDKFVDELVVRRELAANFVFYNPLFDQWEGLPSWAKKTLEAHEQDKRTWAYTFQEWEKALTHDEVWNTCQKLLLKTGCMPNYLRMYWGKKILEWSESPKQAFVTASKLNNLYALDGRDFNSWAGIAWCFGKHDRPWQERSVYGMVRCMMRSGLEKKFDVPLFLQRNF